MALHAYVLADHEHPVAVLRDVDGTRHCFLCFHVDRRTAILLAFGALTSGRAIRPYLDDRIFVIYNSLVCEVGGSRI